MKIVAAAFLIAVMLTAVAGCQRNDKINPDQSYSYEVPSEDGKVPFPPGWKPCYPSNAASGSMSIIDFKSAYANIYNGAVLYLAWV